MSTGSTNKVVEEGSQAASANGLAPELRRLFWEYDFDSLSWERDGHFITKRILTHGGLRAWDWLRDRIGDAALRQWILDNNGAGMDKRRLRYWELILELPSDEINQWVAAQSGSIWGKRSERLDQGSAA
ncbi:MAG: hypothetical protein AUG51_22015 [Acidobacteria bacterium 13_1_20CM_3_53_8]|nr:MAG: hypothetical protein AUG51_22015 [Acidobacteria bacterium 13_1_20CM_3_53_8]